MAGRIFPGARAALPFGVGLAARGLEAAGKLGLYTLAVAWLGESPSGLFFLALSVLHIGGTVTRLGTERVLSRNTAAYLASGQVREARDTILAGLGLNLLTSAGAGLVLWLAAEPIAVHLLRQPPMTPLVRLLVLALPAQAMAYTAGYILIGLGRGGAAQLLMNALPPVAALAVLALGARSSPGAFLGFALAYVVCAFAAMAVIAQAWARAPRPATPTRADRLPGLGSGLRTFFWVELIQAAIITAPVLALARVAAAAEVGAFSLASRLSMLVLTLVVSLSAMSAARMGASLRREDAEELRRVVRRLGVVALACGIPAVALLAVGSPLLMDRLGVTTSGAAGVVTLMALGQLPFVLAPGRDTLLAMGGGERELRDIAIVQAALMAVGCLTVVPLFGLWGAAALTATTWTCGALSCHFAAKRRAPHAFGRPTRPLVES
ncbi:lipopolysaccharide biosynthesis protein [Phenylobacterium sp.]|uniref:lipopolysaccharide biosynthesis protein n=1 Tax=Phenylobacterium sp. TaxID=1871053 RepID=UPI00378527CC